MSRADKRLQAMRNNPKDVRFGDACAVANDYFGKARQDGTSHCIWGLPWKDNPVVNLQRGADGKAKAYQVRQLLAAVDRVNEEKAAAAPTDETTTGATTKTDVKATTKTDVKPTADAKTKPKTDVKATTKVETKTDVKRTKTGPARHGTDERKDEGDDDSDEGEGAED